MKEKNKETRTKIQGEISFGDYFRECVFSGTFMHQ